MLIMANETWREIAKHKTEGRSEGRVSAQIQLLFLHIRKFFFFFLHMSNICCNFAAKLE